MRLDVDSGTGGFLVQVSHPILHTTDVVKLGSNFLTCRPALQLHEAKMLRHVDRLDSCIEADAAQGRPSNAKNLAYWFGFDAMGDFVFNHPFGMLEAKTWHHLLVRSYRAIELLGPFGPAPWLVQIGFRLLPRLGKLRDWHEMTTWCRQMMEQRLENEALQKELDMTHYLMMRDDPVQGEVVPDGAGYSVLGERNRFWLHGDSLLIIVAGRCVIPEILSSALTGVFITFQSATEHLLPEVKEGLEFRHYESISLYKYEFG